MAVSESATTTDARAADEEERYRRVALTLLALELAVVLRALGEITNTTDLARVYTIARASLLSPIGQFRQRWVERFGGLMQESARAVAGLPTPTVTRAIDARAALLAEEVTQTTAKALRVTESATVRIVSGPSLTAVVNPEQRAAVLQQRFDTLVPLVGSEPAERIIAALGGGSQSVAKVAQTVLRTTVTPLTRSRARTIARTESIGAQNLTEYETAISRGMREKKWIDQADARVRDSHRRCHAEGWIPIRQRHVNGLQYPGERPAPADEVIGCRCGQVFRR